MFKGGDEVEIIGGSANAYYWGKTGTVTRIRNVNGVNWAYVEIVGDGSDHDYDFGQFEFASLQLASTTSKVKPTVIYTKQQYKGYFIYVDTIDGKTRITTNLFHTRQFKSVHAAKIAITKY